MGGGGLKGRIHLQEGEEVGDVSAGRRRSRRATREGGGGGRSATSSHSLEGVLGDRGEPGKTETLSDQGGSLGAGRGWQLLRNVEGRGKRGRGGGAREGVLLFLLVVVDKVTADPIRAEADGVERTTRLRFILGVSVQVTQLLWPVGKLALAPVLAQAILGERPTQFGFIAGRGRGAGN